MQRASVLVVAALAACEPGPPPWDVPGPDWTEAARPSPAPASQLPRLEVRGAELVTANDGRPLRLRGVNVCSLEFDPAGASWELGAGGSALLATLADPQRWNANVVRMPVNQQWFLEDPAYVERVERLLDDAGRLGVYVLLDAHWEVGRALDPYHLNILPLPTFGEGNTTEAFWHRATSRFANRTNLLYDLINEPHDESPELTAGAMAALVARIRMRQPEAVIVVAGMDWAHSVDWYRERPIPAGNVVYSAHQYLPYDTPDLFESNFLRAARELPVILGEFGVEPEGTRWHERLIDAAESGGLEGWLPWAIGCGFGKDDESAREPLVFLSARMRELNP